MQCPSCQFENMPGSGHCARCAASLMLQSAEIDVNPPRASALSKRLPVRSVASARRGITSVRSTFASIFGLTRPVTSFRGQASDYLTLAIPGLHQWRAGEETRAMILGGVFLALAVATILVAGTGPGAMLLGFLFAWHVVASVDAVARDFVTPADRIRLTGITALTVGLLLYLPGIWLIGRVATPMNIALATSHFSPGDVVWYNRSATPAVGDLVLYDLPTAQVSARDVDTIYPRVYRVGGPRINRLVATSGQTVKLEKDGKLFVDGELSPWQPTGSSLLPRETEIKVRPDCVLILPEDLLPGRTFRLDPEVALRLSVVADSTIRGSLVARTFPTHRLRLY